MALIVVLKTTCTFTVTAQRMAPARIKIRERLLASGGEEHDIQTRESPGEETEELAVRLHAPSYGGDNPHSSRERGCPGE